MRENAVQERVTALSVSVQRVIKLRSGRSNQETEKYPLLIHFIVSFPRGPEVKIMHSLSEICELRITVDKYVPTKGLENCKHFQRLGHTQSNCE